MPEVAVVGAGLSGLSAARLLEAAGLEVVVLEADHRVGGRLLTVEAAGGRFDLGARWIGSSHTRVASLADGLGLERVSRPPGGRIRLELGAQRPSEARPLTPLALLQLGAVVRWTDWRAGRAGADPGGRGVTVGDRLATRALGGEVRGLATAVVTTLYGLEPAELPLDVLLRDVRAAGSCSALAELRGGLRASRFAQGAGALGQRLAEDLADVRLGWTVRSLLQRGERVRLVGGDGSVLDAEAVVLAAPPGAVSRMAFTPELSAARHRWLSGHRAGTAVTCVVVYEQAFWQAAGWSGEALSARGPLRAVSDHSDPRGHGALVATAGGRSGRELADRSPPERREAVLTHLAQLFGPAARAPVAYRDQAWTPGQHTAGGPTAVPTVAGEGFDPRQAHGRVHWAGAELAGSWRGYMEGAVASGHRAAREVLGLLEGRDAEGLEPDDHGASVRRIDTGPEEPHDA